jgi:hypothetical protein
LSEVARAAITTPIENPTVNVTISNVTAYPGLKACTCSGEFSMWILKIKSISG